LACNVDSVLVLQLLEGGERIHLQVFDDPDCGAPLFVDKGGMLSTRDRELVGPFQDNHTIGIPVHGSHQSKVVRIELELFGPTGGVKRWCACPKLPAGGQVSPELPVRPAAGIPTECLPINLDDIRKGLLGIDAGCSADFECDSGNCECVLSEDSEAEPCSKRVCAPVSCPCRYFDGSACTVEKLPDGSHDPDDCLGDAVCVGGMCRLPDGAAGCGFDVECASDNCVCTDPTCTERQCLDREVADCGVCEFFVEEPPSCDSLVGDDILVVPNCFGGCQNGECVTEGEVGDRCLDDTDCLNENPCICARDDCRWGVCSVVSCDRCQYLDAEGVNCLPTLDGNPGEECGDADVPKKACTDSSKCLAAMGVACTANAECASGVCECGDSACLASHRKCGASCPCGYVDQAGQCVGHLIDGVQDIYSCEGEDPACERCDAAGWACFHGQCLTTLHSPCEANADCSTGQCECASADCQERVCVGSDADCVCGWSADGGCLQSLDNGVDAGR